MYIGGITRSIERLSYLAADPNHTLTSQLVVILGGQLQKKAVHCIVELKNLVIGYICVWKDNKIRNGWVWLRWHIFLKHISFLVAGWNCLSAQPENQLTISELADKQEFQPIRLRVWLIRLHVWQDTTLSLAEYDFTSWWIRLNVWLNMTSRITKNSYKFTPDKTNNKMEHSRTKAFRLLISNYSV